MITEKNNPIEILIVELSKYLNFSIKHPEKTTIINKYNGNDINFKI